MMLSVQFILLSVIPLALASRDAYQEKIFKMHNEYRKQILECKVDGQPSAKRMPPLIWDEELASQAETLAKSCTYRYKSPTSRRFASVGQNTANCEYLEDVMKSWFGQHKWYKFKDHYCSQPCSEYLQMVSANTTHIGCAYNECPYGDDGSYVIVIVCNYGPGVKLNMRPYEAKNIDEVCPVKRNRVAGQPRRGQRRRTNSTMKNSNRNKPRKN
ncbi:unnamed protein product [Trichobilharzia szidati]|nr:unnamed protein product [Trichobilharzia szidati]